MSLAEVLDCLIDPGSAQPIEVPRREFSGEYATKLRQAAQRSGVDESVQALFATIDGHRVVVIGGEFEFLAGSIGQQAADTVVAGYRAATRDRLPVVTLPTSGGTRMQEGTAAFFRMTDIARAAGEHLRTGAVRVCWLRNPTSGGVMATWGSYGDVSAAEPGAMLGFLGPRVYEALFNEPFPAGVQTAENLAQVGVIDEVVALPELRGWVSRILSVACGDDDPRPITTPVAGDVVDAWEAITVTRDPQRVGPRAILDLLTDRTDLNGSGTGESGSGIQVSLGRLRGRRCLVIAQLRTTISPSDLRVAQRGLKLADRIGLPVVSVIDTPGGELSQAAEESAMAGEIARTLQMLTTLSVPSVSCIMGQGCGGAALALIPARTVLCMANAWVSPLPPEGASSILYRSVDRAADMAREQGVGAMSLLQAGVVDAVVAEHPDLVSAVSDAVCAALDDQ